MLIFSNIRNKGLLRKLKDYYSNFLYSRELFLGESFIVPFFFFYSHYTNNPAHKISAGNPSNEIFEEIYVNTKKNCIHFICKNDIEYLTLVGVER